MPVADDDGAELRCTADNLRLQNASLEAVWPLKVFCELIVTQHSPTQPNTVEHSPTKAAHDRPHDSDINLTTFFLLLSTLPSHACGH